MELNHDVPTNTTSGTPNSKIPVTHASAAKLRASILKRHLDTQTSQLAQPKRGVRFDLPEDILQQSAAAGPVQSDGGIQEDFQGERHLALVQEDLDSLPLTCFHDKLGEWIEGVHFELFRELEVSDGTASLVPQTIHETGAVTSDATPSASSLLVQPSSDSLSIETYTALIQEQRTFNNYSRSRPRSRIGSRSRTRTLTPSSQETAPIISSQPIGNGPCVPAASDGAASRGVEEMPFVYPDDRHCYGLERLRQMSSVFMQPSDGLFNFLNTLCPKFLTAARQDVFHHETLPPIFTITQTANRWTDLKFLINHNDYSGGSLMTDLCFFIECEQFYESYSLFHNATFSLVASGGVQLGSCKYHSTNRHSPTLLVECELTRETFVVCSRNYSPGYQDSNFFVRQVTEFEEGEAIDEGPDNSLVAVISRRLPRTLSEGSSEVYPLQERLVVTFCGKVHPYVKGTLIAASLVLKHDLFK